MRTIEIEDIICKNNLNNKINKLQPKHILARALCVKMQAMAKKNIIDFNSYIEPKKNYEIYKVIINKKEEIFIANIKYLPEEDLAEKELFFDKNIAFEVYRIFNCLNDNAVISCSEVMELCETDLLEKHEQINNFKRIDNEFFEKAVERNKLVHDKNLEIRKDNRYSIIEENQLLKKQLNEYKAFNKEISEKLKYCLEKYDELKNSSMIKKKERRKLKWKLLL